MRPIATFRRLSVSVDLLVTIASRAKAAEPIKLPFREVQRSRCVGL